MRLLAVKSVFPEQIFKHLIELLISQLFVMMRTAHLSYWVLNKFAGTIVKLEDFILDGWPRSSLPIEKGVSIEILELYLPYIFLKRRWKGDNKL